MTSRSVARITWGLVALVLAFVQAPMAVAQEGHPFSGSWVGDYGPTKQDRTRVVVVMDWTGKDLAVTINPGANAIPAKVVTVNPDKWSLHVEAEGKDAQGRPVMHVIDGTVDDLGTYNRSIAGTWNAGTVKGTFSITRQ